MKRIANSKSAVTPKSAYRVFISYSHDDRDLADRVVAILSDNGLRPVWDRDFEFGRGFHEQIKTRIAHAHVFLPIVTEKSSLRGWVHQEIGFAMALNVPVLPVGRGAIPGQMLEQLLAVRLDRELKAASRQLSHDVFERLVASFRDPSLAHYTCTQLREERAEAMARHAQEVLDVGEFGRVRQLGALSSFHIPDQVISDQVWKERHPPGEFPGEYHCKLQRAERLALDKHARHSGCSLIVNPDVYGRVGRAPLAARLKPLREFLASMPDELVTVAVDPKLPSAANVTLVGDWFAAESVSMAGPRQTNFTTHAPSMQSRIQQFDEELHSVLKATKVRPEDSRRIALRKIDRIISSLKRSRRR